MPSKQRAKSVHSSVYAASVALPPPQQQQQQGYGGQSRKLAKTPCRQLPKIIGGLLGL